MTRRVLLSLAASGAVFPQSAAERRDQGTIPKLRPLLSDDRHAVRYLAAASLIRLSLGRPAQEVPKNAPRAALADARGSVTAFEKRFLYVYEKAAFALSIGDDRQFPCLERPEKKTRWQSRNYYNRPSVLWRNPQDMATRNLFYGPGGEQHRPRGPFLFLKEDLDGSNPKFIVRDQDGVRWKVKLGTEARPETAASRLVWAVGYFADEDYLLADLRVDNMPPRLHRGQKLVASDGSAHGVRLKRYLEGEKKIGTWEWRRDPFTGTRELNGLRVMMALINNWDLKDENNGVYQEKGGEQEGPERVYLITDLGASFGTAGPNWPHEKAKGNLESYRASKFIRRVNGDNVDFYEPSRPSYHYLVNPHEYFSRRGLLWIGKQIPRRDARWMGELLAQLSPNQIRDAFRAAGYAPDEVEGFAKVVRDRIANLTDL